MILVLGGAVIVWTGCAGLICLANWLIVRYKVKLPDE
jgi:hypothetical protein